MHEKRRPHFLHAAAGMNGSGAHMTSTFFVAAAHVGYNLLAAFPFFDLMLF